MQQEMSKRWFLALSLVVLASGALAAQATDPTKGKANKEENLKTVQGIVKVFTFAPDAQVIGVALKDGIALHWPVQNTFRFTDILNEGDEVKATGRWRKLPDGTKSLEVLKIINVSDGKTAVSDEWEKLQSKSEGK